MTARLPGGEFKGSVPALRLDDGQVLTEGPAILQYIADQKLESRLAPKSGTPERYRLLEWLNFITSEIHKSFRRCSIRRWMPR
jgi:glutathione S-transferase